MNRPRFTRNLTGKWFGGSWDKKIDGNLVASQSKAVQLLLWVVPKRGDTEHVADIRKTSRLYAAVFTLGVSEVLIRRVLSRIETGLGA